MSSDDELDHLLGCPYDKSHRVAASRMSRHLVRCRKNFDANEVVFCPFNKNHSIYSQEIMVHKDVCTDNPKNMVSDLEKITENGSSLVVDPETFLCDLSPSSSSTSTRNNDFLTTKNSPVKKESQDADQEENTSPLIVELDLKKLSPNNKNFKRRLKKREREKNTTNMAENAHETTEVDDEGEEQQEDTTSYINESENSTSPVNELFDYKKYQPTQEEREAFLKLINKTSPPRPQVVHQEHFYPSHWPAGYTIQQPHIPISNPFEFQTFNTNFIPPPPPPPIGLAPFPQAFFTEPWLAAPAPVNIPALNYSHGRYVERPRYNYQRNRHYIRQTPVHNHDSQKGLENHYKTNGYKSLDSTSSTTTSPASSPDLAHETVSTTDSVEEEVDDNFNHVQEENNNSSVVMNESSTSEDNFPLNHENDENEDELKESEKPQQEKLMRKCKKKLSEILVLEQKQRNGVRLDADQLKKLSRKRDLERELACLALE